MLNKTEVKEYVHQQGYRLASGCEEALVEVLKKAIAAGIFYTRPAKTIKPTDILRFVSGKKETA